VRSIADAPLTTCTVCGGRLRKVFSPVGIVFKGSGFYRTDSRGKPAKADGDGDKAKKPADATSSSKSSTSEGGGSTSKPKAAEKSA
jgi:predicted nucleic acid-binding Zn ribbon protein